MICRQGKAASYAVRTREKAEFAEIFSEYKEKAVFA